MSLAKLDKSLKRRKSSSPQKALWEGPESDTPNGGITQSLIAKWLCCRYRFAVLVKDGLGPADDFRHRLEFGSMWHICEEALANGKEALANGDDWDSDDWIEPLLAYCQELLRRYPLQQEQVEHWYHVCRITFPVYVDYWSRNVDVLNRTPLLQEQVFKVPYKLSSGRTVYLRGKWDSVDLLGKGKSAKVYLKENKTKGDIIEADIQRQLHFDLQTGVYLVALQAALPSIRPDLKAPLGGVVYNVVRRPLSGGRGSIRQHKPTKSNPSGESKEAFYSRLRDDVIAAEPEYFFMRWTVEFTSEDLYRFRKQCLDPVLENICYWWEEVSGKSHKHGPPNSHYRFPYGVYNPVSEGKMSEVDEYLNSGSMSGLQRVTNLFKELEDV